MLHSVQIFLQLRKFLRRKAAGQRFLELTAVLADQIGDGSAAFGQDNLLEPVIACDAAAFDQPFLLQRGDGL